MTNYRELEKLKKNQLIVKCETLGIHNIISKTKSQLITLIYLKTEEKDINAFDLFVQS